MALIFNQISKWREHQRKQKQHSTTLGFVPTMGHLHHGHLSLIKRAKDENQKALVSIFINPTQFNCPKDYDSYPKTLDEDLQKLQDLHVDYILTPDYEEMYPQGKRFSIQENHLSQIIEGKSRPGHFSGVLTVVMKLLQIVSPHKAYFGEKDYQQLQLVKDMVKEFFLPIQIIGCPTLRDKNGLPLSSRNSKLTPDQYEKVKNFSKILASALPYKEVAKKLEAERYSVEYVEEYNNRRLGAIRINNIRLIDNIPCPTEVPNL